MLATIVRNNLSLNTGFGFIPKTINLGSYKQVNFVRNYNTESNGDVKASKCDWQQKPAEFRRTRGHRGSQYWDPLFQNPFFGNFWDSHPVKDFIKTMERLDDRPFKESKSWLPAVDLAETNNSITIIAELPGLKKEDIKITVENGCLTLKGERKWEENYKEDSEEKLEYKRIERQYGSFSRTFALPENANTEKIKASFKDGVLQIEVEKSVTEKSKEVNIQ